MAVKYWVVWWAILLVLLSLGLMMVGGEGDGVLLL